jgi:pilus assembly protein CpaF
MIPAALHARSLAGLLAPIAALLDDESVAEIMINGPERIYIERAGRIEPTTLRFESESDLLAALRAIAQFVARPLGPEHPILEARLPDGSRVEAVLPPTAADGPTVSIRRFTRCALTFDALCMGGTLDPRTADYLARAVDERRNLLVSGGTGSGKTSLLNALSSLLPADERVIVLEDARELQLAGAHVVRLESRPPDARGRGEVSLRQLLRATLRLRPDRIVVGEIRGAEAFELVQAMTTGHGGCLGTIHASQPRDALSRLEALVMMSDVALPLAALRTQIGSAIDVIVQIERGADGRRRVTDVLEVEGTGEGGAYRTHSPFPCGEHARSHT